MVLYIYKVIFERKIIMKKALKKVLAIVLTFIIALSAVSVAFAAVDNECPHCGKTGFTTEKAYNNHVLDCYEQTFLQKVEDAIDLKEIVNIYVTVNDFIAENIDIEGVIVFIIDAVIGLLAKI